MSDFIEANSDEIMLRSMTNVFVEKKLDPVGKEDADIDNDGDTDKTDKYLHNRRKAIGKAIKKKKGIKEGHCDEEGVECSDVEKKKDSKKSMKEGYHLSLIHI